ncbi:hypothetical protein BDW62DRAFT_182986 [Aspergillus aurantiobrunneus]
MDIRIRLFREPPVFFNTGTVSGHVVFASETQIDIGTVAITLSGLTTSRLYSGRLVESHQLFKISKQLFPLSKCASSSTSRNAALRPGEHAFPFSIQFPHATQCYKTTTGRNSHHLMRKLPPSTGDKSSPEEIKYVLEATVHQDGLTRKATRGVHFHPISTIALPPQGQHVQTKTMRITYRADSSEFLSPPSTCEVAAKLLNGPFLFLGQPIPLALEITNTTQTNSDIYLHGFQSRLFETTEVRIRGAAESLTRSCPVQTMVNLRQLFVPELRNDKRSDELVVSLRNKLWNQYCVPLFLTPTFETCNISRSYKLEIRLRIGFGGNDIRILEFQFPVYIVALALSVTGSPEIEMEPAPEYCEKEILGKLELESL